MIIHLHRSLGDAADALAEALGRPLSRDEGLTADEAGTVVAHWDQLDRYTEEELYWTTPEWAAHLAEPLREHPFVSAPDGSRTAILHLSVRLHPKDRELSAAEWSEIGNRLARAAGIAPPGDAWACRWIAVRDKPDRMDLIGNLIRLDGTWAATPRRLADVLQKEARRIEADLLLRAGHPRAEKAASSTGPSVALPRTVTATSSLAGILNQLAAEEAGPVAAVRQLVEQVGRQAAALPGHETAAAGRDLFWASRRLYGVQEQLGEIAARLAPAQAPPSPVALPAPVPASATTARR